MNIVVFALIMLCITFNTIAQLALKAGMGRIGHFVFNIHNIIPIAIQTFSSPYIVFGLANYIGSVIIWLMVLSRIPVSMAYPMSSLGYVTSAIAAYYIFGENLGVMRVSGILIILIGVFLVAKST